MKEEEIIEELKKTNPEFLKIYHQHRELDASLSQFTSKHYLTAEEEVEKKRIQKEKLHLKDKMAEMIRQYKNNLKSS